MSKKSKAALRRVEDELQEVFSGPVPNLKQKLFMQLPRDNQGWVAYQEFELLCDSLDIIYKNLGEVK